jgi:hypothetical protein
VAGIDNEEGYEDDERTIMYRMGSESVHSASSSRVVNAEEGCQQVQEQINESLQDERPKAVVAQFNSNVGRRWIMAGTFLLMIVITAVGVGIAFSSGGSGGEDMGGEAIDQCDFTDIEQPNAFMQCQCNQEITKWSEDVHLRYQDLLSTVIPVVNPDFVEPETSCVPNNLALVWLATYEYSLAMTDMVTLTNRYILALLFHTWTGTNWKINDGWLLSLSECMWYGITCDGTAITGIELGGNSLQSGPEDGLPTEMFTLTSLSEL